MHPNRARTAQLSGSLRRATPAPDCEPRVCFLALQPAFSECSVPASIRACVELRVREPVRAADEDLAIRHPVGGGFDEVGDVEVHSAPEGRRNQIRTMDSTDSANRQRAQGGQKRPRGPHEMRQGASPVANGSCSWPSCLEVGSKHIAARIPSGGTACTGGSRRMTAATAAAGVGLSGRGTDSSVPVELTELFNEASCPIRVLSS